MIKEKIWKSALWSLKQLTTAALGLLWILAPSIAIYNAGMIAGPYMDWTPSMVYLAATNAFIIWTSIQVGTIIFDRYVGTKIRFEIEKYHEEFNMLKGRWSSKSGEMSELDTIKTLKLKMAG